MRGCAQPLAEREQSLRCPRGHCFDRARRGWVNLLQPQDRRSRAAGDRREAALARRRLCEAGLEAPLHQRLLATLAELPVREPALLDVGCGEGSALAFLAARQPLSAHGVDLSADAIDLAASLLPEATWVVANADRGLPFAGASFDLVFSLLARRPTAELARVLRPKGMLLVVVPGAEDLAELREATQGEVVAKDRLGGVASELAGTFELARREHLAWRAVLDRATLADLLASSYRGARHRERERFAALAELAVTCARDLGWFTRRSGAAPQNVD